MEEPQKFYTVRGYQLLEQNNKLLTSSMEDYLEMIYRNSLEEGYIRINELAELLNVQAPSATKMVQKLTHLGLLDYKKYGIIFLTENGKEIGKFLFNRHAVLEDFLRHIGVTESILFETELIEHNITANTLHRIELLNRFFDTFPDIMEKFKKFINE
ncbi:MAG: iron dependent repressor, metal binding and dimerization domain protein [Bacillota bacterium]|nr:iron dependent repressor, metal binding and dimerization domain protein [Bacillota bacterium]